MPRGGGGGGGQGRQALTWVGPPRVSPTPEGPCVLLNDPPGYLMTALERDVGISKQGNDMGILLNNHHDFQL